VSTWTRVYLPRGERWRRPIQYYVVPGLLLAFVGACMWRQGTGSGVLRTTIFYWASWHFTAQNYGLLRLWQRKHGVVGSPIAGREKALVFLGAFYCVMHRLFTGPWELFYGPVYHLRPPAWLVNTIGVALAALAAVYLVELARSRPPARHRVRPLFIASTVVGFAVPFLLIKNGTAAFAAAACWHGIQYLGIVWCYNRRRYAGRSDPDARLLAWVSQPGRSAAYFALLGALALSVYGAVWLASRAALNFPTWSLIAWTSLTLGHYYLDGVIWKFKQYDLQQQLIAR
jgi:hypothetical protein